MEKSAIQYVKDINSISQCIIDIGKAFDNDDNISSVEKISQTIDKAMSDNNLKGSYTDKRLTNINYEGINIIGFHYMDRDEVEVLRYISYFISDRLSDELLKKHKIKISSCTFARDSSACIIVGIREIDEDEDNDNDDNECLKQYVDSEIKANGNIVYYRENY